MSDLKRLFEGGVVSDNLWTLTEILDDSAEHIIAMGPTLHYVTHHQTLFWPKISQWLGSDPNRKLQILIQHRLGRDLFREHPKQLATSKRVFRDWLDNAISGDRALKLSVSTSRAMIRSGVTIVNPQSNDGYAVVVPLLFQTLPDDKVYFVVKRAEHPTIFASIWAQVGVLLQKARPLKRNRQGEQ